MKFANVFNKLVNMSCYISGLFKIGTPPPPAKAQVFERFCWLHSRIEIAAPVFEHIRPGSYVVTAFDLLKLSWSKTLDDDAVYDASLNVIRDLENVQLFSTEELDEAIMTVHSANDLLVDKGLRDIYVAKFVIPIHRKGDAKEGREEARKLCKESHMGMLWFHPSYTKEDKGGQEGHRKEL